MVSRTPTPTRTPLYTNTPAPTNTPIYTGTPNYTNIPPPTYYPSATAIATGTPAGPGGPGGTNDPLGIGALVNILNGINDFINWFINNTIAFIDWLLRLLRWVLGTARNLFTMFFNALSPVDTTFEYFVFLVAVGVLLLKMVITILFNVMGVIAGWMGEVTFQVQILIAAYNAAAPTPIPGMPLCSSAPMSGDICAIYYILEYTVLSGGLGRLLLPILIIVMNLVVVLLFLKFIKSAAHKLQEIFNAS